MSSLIAAEGGYQDFILKGGEWAVLILAGLSAVLAILVGLGLARNVMAADEGTPKMREIAKAIQEGASAYLRRQFKTIGMILVPLAVIVFLTSTAIKKPDGTEALSFAEAGTWRTLAFILGCLASGATGLIGMTLATRGNVRTAAAAKTGSMPKALTIAFRTGGVAGMDSMRRSDELEHAFGQLDARVEVAVLLVAVGERSRIVGGAPFDVERHRHTRSVGTAPGLCRVVEQHAISLVADAPLAKGNVADVIGPHLCRLDLESLAKTDAIELLHIQERLAAPHQSRPVIERAITQLQSDEQPGSCLAVPAPPPPGLDGHVRVTCFVGGSEQHLDPAD